MADIPIVLENLSSFSEKELEDFANKNNFSFTKGELIYIRDFLKENKRNINWEELRFFERIRKEKNSKIFSSFDKVSIDSENPHVAEAYANYLRLTEQQKDKLGTYPCLDDLADASYSRTKQIEPLNKGFYSAPQKVVLSDEKIEDGRVAVSFDVCLEENREDVIVETLMNLFESRYKPFFVKLTGESKEPNKENAENLSEFSSKIGIPTSKYDFYDTKSSENSTEIVYACGYANANCVARHYPKEDDKILLIKAESKTLFINKLSTFFGDRKLVKLIVDARYTHGCRLVDTLNGFITSFKSNDDKSDGMILLVRPRDEEELLEGIKSYGLDVSVIGEVTSDGNLSCGNINLPREFIDGYSVRKTVDINLFEKRSLKTEKASSLCSVYLEKGDMAAASSNSLSDYSVCSQKGLAELFDYSIGGTCVMSPIGGKYLLTPSNVSAYKFPVSCGTENVVLSASSIFPSLSMESPFIGAVNSVVCAVVKLVLAGVKRRDITVNITKTYKIGQESDAFSALLGAFSARQGLGVDTLKNVVKECQNSTFIACATGCSTKDNIVHNTFKQVGRVYRLSLRRDSYGMIDFEYASRLLDCISENIENGNIIAATVIESGGAQAAIIKSCIGNGLGFDFEKASEKLFVNAYGDVIVMCLETADLLEFSPEFLGCTDTDGRFDFSKERSLNNFGITQSFTAPMEGIFRTTAASRGLINNVRFKTDKSMTSLVKRNKPSVVIPVFDGTTGDEELINAFKRAGGDPIPFRFFECEDKEAAKKLADLLDSACILAIPSGVYDENKICTLFRHDELFEKLEEFIKEKDGLVYGVGVGAKALLSLGMITSDKLRKRNDESILLKTNNLGRRVNTISEIRVASVLSPWLYCAELGEKYITSVNINTGALSFNDGILERLIEKGQIATQYVDHKGFATMESPCNPTGTSFAVESLTSEDGRVIARTSGNSVCTFMNREGNYDIKIFESGVKYFK